MIKTCSLFCVYWTYSFKLRLADEDKDRPLKILYLTLNNYPKGHLTFVH